MPITPLLASIAAAYTAEGRPAADLTVQALDAAPDAFPRQPACAYDGAIRSLLATSAHPVAAALLAAQQHIAWDMNPVADRSDSAIAALITVAPLLGPGGPIPAADLRLGFCYMRPDAYYPLHNHDADETYVIVAGEALWTAGTDTRQRRTGDMIHHPSLLPHAFRTGPAGFLALWRWSGDINTQSYAFLSDPDAAPLPLAAGAC